jgi:hypothetical protein
MSETTKQAESALPSLTKLANTGTGMFVLGLIVTAIGLFLDKSEGHKIMCGAYLYGFIFWMGVTLGCATVTYLHHTIRAQWSLSILRILEAGNKNIPLMFAFFLPILILTVGSKLFYPWMEPQIFEHLHKNKQAWFGTNGINWAIRSVFYFGFWFLTLRKLNASSLLQDTNLDENLAEARKSFAPPMGVLHVILLTFAMTDWLMSLSPNWMSTLYGAWHMATELLTAVALGTILVTSLRHKRPFSDIVSPFLTKDLGNILLGFTMVFGYFTLSQFLIIWSANLPEETMFFLQRFDGPWVFVGAFIVIGQFFAPFLCLITGKAKRTAWMLRLVAMGIFGMRVVDIWWQVAPFFKTPSQSGTIVFDLGVLLLIGGVWTSRFVHNLKQHELIPAHDRRLHDVKIAMEAHGHA